MKCADCEYFCTDSNNKKAVVPFEHCRRPDGFCAMKELFTQQKATDEACYMFKEYQEDQ